MAPSGYAKKMPVEISPSSAGAESNYAVKVALVKGSGTNGAGVGYLGDQCLNWPYDIRWADNEGNELSFYRAESDSTDGTWWIKVSSIPTGDNTTIWVYFGKYGDSDASSGANTFILSRDFESGDLSDWETAQAGWSCQSSQKAEGSYAGKGVYNSSGLRLLAQSISPGRAVLIHAWVRPEHVSYSAGFFRPSCGAAGALYAMYCRSGFFKYYPGSAYTDLPTATAYSVNTWYEVEVAIDNPNQLFRWWVNGASKGSAALKNGSGTTVGTTEYMTKMQSYSDANSGGVYYIDQIWVRPYVYPEPSVGTPGAMQDAGGAVGNPVYAYAQQ